MPLASPASDDSRGGDTDRRAGGRAGGGPSVCLIATAIHLFDRDRRPRLLARLAAACSPRRLAAARPAAVSPAA
jgi:hypothetical protein